MSQYHPLTEAEAIEIARTINEVFPTGEELVSKEIGDGNLNLVFHITQPATGASLIVKQALPYAKVVGESWPLSLDRARIESEALVKQGELAPGLAPRVYKTDNELALTIMEDLSDHVIMRKGLIEGGVYPKFAEHISEFIARTLFFTSDLGMNQQEKKRLVESFINPDLCKITEDLIFEDPYYDSPNNNIEAHLRDAAEAIWADEELKLEVAFLREKFLTNAQALLHGDLHTGSIFVTPDSTKVIDPEFAYYGPMGFDIGAVFANLLLNYASQEHWSADEAARRDRRAYLLNTIRDIWTLFEAKFRKLWNEHGADRVFRAPGYQDSYLSRLLQDTVGFAGAKTVRRIYGLSHVADIDSIPDAGARERAQRLALSIGTSLIKHNRKAVSIEDLLDIASAAVAK
ncbi:S-methyl-5-thioribose kinase [Cohnella thailandensis]|uniref:Methylthioribose kinase n=1 Tax=Cohnella thailandensis TaxID=557557 RepID=A0A841SW26_9BACL|nr:S-methyl-5-thioribose kinase [Cohnella thailandensis]MBB6633827.1 S-methyl-5-thioribose kinase [Cohnella thailandensis]MBP1972510.1 5-methylthioribose kinase [Cohnella thailandensis]